MNIYHAMTAYLPFSLLFLAVAGLTRLGLTLYVGPAAVSPAATGTAP